MNGPAGFTIGPTETLYSEINAAYRHFNRTLFNSELPECLITLQRSKGHLAMTSMYRFVRIEDSTAYTHELSINPSYFAASTPKHLLSNLVHEMVHMELALKRGPGGAKTAGYHDKEWGGRMESIGLVPSDTAKPGGRKIGFRMLHYIKNDGPFDQAAQALLESGWMLTWIDRLAETFDPELMADSTEADPATAPPHSERPVSTAPAPSPTVKARGVASAPAPGAEPPNDASETSSNAIIERPSHQTSSHDSEERLPHVGSSLNLRPVTRIRQALIEPVKRTAGKRQKYVCKGCSQVAVWGRAGLNIHCGECELPLTTEV